MVQEIRSQLSLLELKRGHINSILLIESALLNSPVILASEPIELPPALSQRSAMCAGCVKSQATKKHSV
jgi:hypothetical protein